MQSLSGTAVDLYRRLAVADCLGLLVGYGLAVCVRRGKDGGDDMSCVVLFCMRM